MVIFSSKVYKCAVLINESMNADTVTIPADEYNYLKRVEKVAKDSLVESIKRGLKDAAEGRITER